MQSGYSQKLKKSYFGITSDSTQSRHVLIFSADSTVELNSIPRHMSRQFKLTFAYHSKNEMITISPIRLTESDRISLINHGFGMFQNTVILKIDRKALVDEHNQTVYILYKNYYPRYKILTLLDNKKFIIKASHPNSYGLVTRRDRGNIWLRLRSKKMLERMAKDPDSFEVRNFSGIEAYRRFGYKYVFGVIEMSTRVEKAN